MKNEDSFIYLSAIGSLAAMANIFPEIVLNTLTDEYSDFDNGKDEKGLETRMKIGEVLVRITKTLGKFHRFVLFHRASSYCKSKFKRNVQQ